MITLDKYNLTEGQQKQVKRFIENLTSTESMPYRSCPYFDGCEDQICPMDPLKEKRIWYSEEGLCLNPEYKKDRAVISQKKLAKKHAPGYFTFEMLNRDIIVKKGIQGIDPDIPESVDRRGQKAIDSLYREREEAWIAGHPELTDTQREKMRERGMKGLDALKRNRREKT